MADLRSLAANVAAEVGYGKLSTVLLRMAACACPSGITGATGPTGPTSTGCVASQVIAVKSQFRNPRLADLLARIASCSPGAGGAPSALTAQAADVADQVGGAGAQYAFIRVASCIPCSGG